MYQNIVYRNLDLAMRMREILEYIHKEHLYIENVEVSPILYIESGAY